MKKKLLALVMALLCALTIVPFAGADTTADTAIAAVSEIPTMSGLVIAANKTSITVANETGSMIKFGLVEGAIVPPIGSTVSLTYSGDAAIDAVADTITITAQAATKTVSGTVVSVNAGTVVVDCGKNVILTLTTTDSTAISGKAKTLSAGNVVTVVYAEANIYLTVVDIATSIEITAVKQEKKTDPDDTTNKTISGKVTKITDTSFTIHTSKNKNYTFKIKSKTKTSGKYEFKVGCTVTVTYDGYASKSPMAKKIKVTKDADAPEYKTMKGVVSQLLPDEALLLKTGHYFHITKNTKNKGTAPKAIGTKVTITYYVKNGENYATKIIWRKN